MKKLFYILIILSGLLFTGCEEVVDVDLGTAAPRLVVDASINWIKGTAGNEQTIYLSTTASYYENEVPPVSNATVFVTNSTGAVFTFTEAPGTGAYTCTDFEPAIGETYVLTVITGGETYTATETLYAVPEIGEIVQSEDGGILGDNTEVRFFFQDNGDENNWYMVRYDTPILAFPEYDVMDDSFSQGNEMFNFIDDSDFEPGQPLDFKLYGISERYYNYMLILLSVAGGNGGGPFETPPATVRGNMVNQTNEDNYALGYFRLSEADARHYVIQ